ncbi:molybdate transport system permease protein [Caulobacter ginsengisoli]|uniref:Molybdenum transport system permease n=1 Tax=Caulobacter ginsengisoli TaxID=400775 RepID=A0ABU0ISC6_9CAUL|nr:molybdate ABC transporter permease subunit [Caulobacter ginsengisoli]MDQ0464913.1 molybdate transport system permease protein [Caulobacter ginsengisoli]
MSLLTPDDWTAVALSLRVASVATLASLPVAFGVALALARGRFPGRSLLDALAHMPLVLPPVATGFALLVLFGKQGVLGQGLAKIGIVFAFDWTGAALAAAIMAFPLMVRPIRLSIEAIDADVDEAARTLGAGPLLRLLRITIPLAMPGLIAALVLGFAKALGEFGATITFVAAIPGETLTLPADIYQAVQTPGAEPRTWVLCALSAAIALGAVWASNTLTPRTKL